jgi:O-antigen/teichoic acid export membrane protein
LGPASTLLVTLGKPRYNMINAFVALALNLVLNIVFIQRFQLKGAAAAATAGYMIYDLLCLIQIYLFMKIQPFRLVFIKFILAGVIPIPALMFSRLLGSPFLAIGVYGLSYFLLLMLFQSFKSEDVVMWKAIRGKMKRRKG